MQVICPECNKKNSVTPEMAGKRGACSHCGAMITVPGGTGPAGEEFEIVGILPSGESITFTLRAADAHAAAEAAKSQGVKVKSVGPKRRASAPNEEDFDVAYPEGGGGDPSDDTIVAVGSPSQWTNIWAFIAAVLLCWLIVPLGYGIWRYLVVRCTRYELTTQRLRLVTGVFSKHIDELELYRVRDTSLYQSFLARLVGIGTVTVISADVTHPELPLKLIRQPREFREQLRTWVERRRRATRARSLEMD